MERQRGAGFQTRFLGCTRDFRAGTLCALALGVPHVHMWGEEALEASSTLGSHPDAITGDPRRAREAASLKVPGPTRSPGLRSATSGPSWTDPSLALL